jgi:hypothetical protein
MVLDQHSRAEQNFLDLTLASPLALPARRCPLFQAGATATAIAVQSAVRQNRQLLKDCAASSASAADFRAEGQCTSAFAVGRRRNFKLSEEWAFLALFGRGSCRCGAATCVYQTCAACVSAGSSLSIRGSVRMPRALWPARTSVEFVAVLQQARSACLRIP